MATLIEYVCLVVSLLISYRIVTALVDKDKASDILIYVGLLIFYSGIALLIQFGVIH